MRIIKICAVDQIFNLQPDPQENLNLKLTPERKSAVKNQHAINSYPLPLSIHTDLADAFSESYWFRKWML